jgi:hypothetical protein
VEHPPRADDGFTVKIDDDLAENVKATATVNRQPSTTQAASTTR